KIESLPEPRPSQPDKLPPPKGASGGSIGDSSRVPGSGDKANSTTRLEATDILGIAPLPVDSIKTTLPGMPGGSVSIATPSLDNALRTMSPAPSTSAPH